MNREQTINDIINSRKTKSAEISRRLVTVKKISAALENFKSISTKIRESIVDDDILQKLDKVKQGVLSLDGEVQGVIEELVRLEERTGRDTINIGIVGRPRMGKSTFLQQLTGLDSSVIPSGSVDYVTGACSYIRHDKTKEMGDAHAVITPYEDKEFLDHVITPFTESLGIPALWGAEDIPDMSLPDKTNLQDSEKQKQLERLYKIRSDYHQYKKLLNAESFTIGKEKILEYVAQSDGQRTKYSNWYAVKKAEIHCKFPQDDIGKIMVCDTPGLGDFTPGAEKALVERLGSTMDVIFILRKLDSTGQVVTPEDTKFYEIIRKAYPSIKVNDWTYMLLNCLHGDQASDVYVKDLATALPTRLGVNILDASDKESVAQAFNAILSDIVKQVKVLDDKLIHFINEKVQKVKSELTSLVSEAKRALPNAQARPDGEVSKETEEIISNLTGELNKYYKELNEHPVTSLPSCFMKTVQEMYNNTPQLEYTEYDKSHPGSWVEKTRDMIRARFIKEFSSIDEAMEEKLIELRQKLKNILISPTGGRLSFIDKEGGDFWTLLKEELEASRGKLEHPIMAIDNVLNMKLNVRAFVLPHLTGILQGLRNDVVPDDSPFYPIAIKADDKMKTRKGKLELAWQRAVGLCDAYFSGKDGSVAIGATPMRALAALVDEFYLLWLCFKESKHEWLSFYGQHAEEVWPEKYGNKNPILAQSKRWMKEVSKLEETACELN